MTLPRLRGRLSVERWCGGGAASDAPVNIEVEARGARRGQCGAAGTTDAAHAFEACDDAMP